MRGSVVFQRDREFLDLGGGVKRRVLAHNENMMMVEVRFEAGGVGAEHSHPHVQCTFVASGRFRFTIDGEAAFVAAIPSPFPGTCPTARSAWKRAL